MEAAAFRFAANRSAQIRAQVAERLGFARVDIFRNTAREENAVDRRQLTQTGYYINILPRLCAGRQRSEERLRHPACELSAQIIGNSRAEIQPLPKILKKPPPAFFQ